MLPGVSVTLTGRTGATTVCHDAEATIVSSRSSPARIRVKVELAGFRPFEEQAVVVGIGEATVDFAMKVGGLQESIKVTANAIDGGRGMQLHRQHALAGSAVLDAHFTDQRGRQPAEQLARHQQRLGLRRRAPTRPTRCCSTASTPGTPRAARPGRSSTTTSSRKSRSAASAQPPEYGGFTGAVVNTITKSGGNRFVEAVRASLHERRPRKRQRQRRGQSTRTRRSAAERRPSS